MVLGGSGCQTEVNQKTGVGIQVNPNSKKDSSSSLTINVSGPLTDVDGDNKLDIIFGVYFSGAQNHRHDDYYVFYKRNLGDGNFDKPKFLYAIEFMKDIQKAGIPFELGVDPNSPRGKYLMNLIIKEEENF